MTATVSIGSLRPSLSPAERRVADVVLADPQAASAQSIGELAERASTSEATVVRFAKKVGYPGYPDLRLALATEAGRRPDRGRVALTINADDDLATVVDKVAALDQRAIVDTADHLDVGTLEAIVEAVVAAHRIEIVGIGAAGLVATDLEQKLRRIRLNAHVSTDGHAMVTEAAVLTGGDLMIAISHSGETTDVVDAVAAAADNGATTAAITNFPKSTLAGAAHHVATTAVAESVFRAGAMASRAAQLTVVDCIYLGVAQRRFDNTVELLERTTEAVRTRRVNPPTE